MCTSQYTNENNVLACVKKVIDFSITNTIGLDGDGCKDNKAYLQEQANDRIDVDHDILPALQTLDTSISSLQLVCQLAVSFEVK